MSYDISAKLSFKFLFRLGVVFLLILGAATSSLAKQAAFEGPDCMYGLEHFALDFVQLEGDCGFMVTEASWLPNGDYQLCVEAVDQVSVQNWTISVNGTSVESGSTPNECWTLAGITSGSAILIEHAVQQSNGDFKICSTNLFVEPDGCSGNSVITILDVDPCEWIATLQFGLDLQGSSMTVSFGDGTPAIMTTETTLQHDYPASGIYTVTYTYEGPAGLISCSETIVIGDCCVDPGFSLTKLPESPSCLNPVYSISGQVCTDPWITHLWEFEDGTTYEGPFPPDHIFTNFVDDDGQVCVTHTVICCDEMASMTVCVDHNSGAYLGLPDETLHFSDILPFTGGTVLDFIQQNANGPSNIPLLIEGTLIADLDADFGPGTWNMGKDAVIAIQGGLYPYYRHFSLNQTVIQSAVRLGYGCCRWKGLESYSNTDIDFSAATIKDAAIALEYSTNEHAAYALPFFESNGSHFLNNYIGIRSTKQFVYFLDFSNNEMVGHTYEGVCTCSARNAFEFYQIPAFYTTKIIGHYGDNYISNYEQGFHFRDSRLKVRDFVVSDLRDYVESIPGFPNNPAGVGAIGIDFHWAAPASSLLDLDRMQFLNFVPNDAASIAVRDHIWKGKHKLFADAGIPHQSLLMDYVAGGYDLQSSFASHFIEGEIKGNLMTLQGPYYSFGVHGYMVLQNNKLSIENNGFYVGSLSELSPLNGGVTLTQPFILPQHYKILDNLFQVLESNGSNIGIYKAYGYSIRRNTIKDGSSAISGINLQQGGKGLVDCNVIKDTKTGIEVAAAIENQYAANYLRENERDMVFSGDAKGENGSLIKLNIYRGSDLESILYQPDAITGQQHHNNYNRWKQTFGDEVVHLGGGSGVSQCQFWYPEGVPVGSLMYPTHNPPGLFVPSSLPIDTIVEGTDFCESINDDPILLLNPSDGSDWASVLEDSAYWAGLSAAETNFMRQEIYGKLLEHPEWEAGYTSLADFKAQMDGDFVGASENLRLDIEDLIADVAAHRESQEPQYAELDTLAAQAEPLLEALVNAGSAAEQDSLQALLDELRQQSDSLQQQLADADELYWSGVQDNIAALLAANSSLSETEWYQWYEKRYNEISLNWMLGIEPDSLAREDLREMAQTCLKDGGRAVLGARGLCEVWLKEYYGEDGCQPVSIVEQHSEEGYQPTAVQQEGLRLQPNPVAETLQLSLPKAGAEDSSFKLEILNASGQKVYEAEFSAAQKELAVSVKNWPNGVYVLRWYAGHARDEVQVRTFVVQH